MCQLIVPLPVEDSVPIFLISVPPEQSALSSSGPEYAGMLTEARHLQALDGEKQLCPPNLSDLTTSLGDRLSHIRWLKPTIFVLL